MRKQVCAEEPRDLAESIHRHLHMYALAAGAAGVSVLALAEPGSAEIIYTPVNQTVTYDRLDLNNDGTVDFILYQFDINPTSTYARTGLVAGGAQAGNGILGGGTPLRAGDLIGPSGWFLSNNNTSIEKGWFHSVQGREFFYCRGPWKNKVSRYLGLRFMINGEVHYGWARVTATCFKGFCDGYLYGYAYETIPNQALRAGYKKRPLAKESVPDPTAFTEPAPAPATLGQLAKGANLRELRRRRAQLVRSQNIQ